MGSDEDEEEEPVKKPKKKEIKPKMEPPKKEPAKPAPEPAKPAPAPTPAVVEKKPAPTPATSSTFQFSALVNNNPTSVKPAVKPVDTKPAPTPVTTPATPVATTPKTAQPPVVQTKPTVITPSTPTPAVVPQQQPKNVVAQQPTTQPQPTKKQPQQPAVQAKPQVQPQQTVPATKPTPVVQTQPKLSYIDILGKNTPVQENTPTTVHEPVETTIVPQETSDIIESDSLNDETFGSNTVTPATWNMVGSLEELAAQTHDTIQKEMPMLSAAFDNTLDVQFLEASVKNGPHATDTERYITHVVTCNIFVDPSNMCH